MQEDFLSILDNLSKSRAEKKKEEYLKKLKEKKKNRKKKKENIGVDVKDSEEMKDSTNNSNTNIDLNNKYGSRTEDIQNILKEENIEIEYVDEEPTTKPKLYENFKNVFEYFVIPKKEKAENYEEDEYYDEEEGEGEEYINGGNVDNIQNYPIEMKLSKKKRKMLNRMKISELKQVTEHPDVVEAWDVTAQDPILLVKFKSMKNTISVPKHWSQKRKFLQNKRGVLKPPFKLPDFIEATGISKIRDNTGNEKRGLKQKMRERMQPKLGRMDIDYQVLHDAFFRYQTKPQLTVHGDVYYENKEYENKMKIYSPGRISEKLRVALGIPENTPPPWIINMQRYGPPPAYPNLKIPGVNAPLLDPTAEITPNLWTPPVKEETAVLVYDFRKNKGEQGHWGDLREIEEDELSEELNEDVSVSDEGESRPVVDNLFSGMDMNLSDETSLKQNLKMNYAAITEGSGTSTSAVPNPNANVVFPNMQMNSKTFFTVLEQKTENIKEKEIYGSSFSYVIPGTQKEEEEVKEEKKVVPPKKEKKIPNFKF